MPLGLVLEDFAWEPVSKLVVRFRASRGAHIAMHVLFGGFLVVWVHGFLFIHREMGKMVAIWGFAYAVVIYWLHRFEVCITDEELIFRGLLGERRIRHDEIGLIRLGFDLSHGGGPLRLFVESRDRPKVAAMSINAKVLPREAIRAVLDLGSRVARSETGGLEDGIVAKVVRRRRSRRP